MKHLLVACLTAVAMALLALARWLDGGPSSSSGHGSGRTQPAKRIDLPSSHYHFGHVPPSRRQVVKAGLEILFSSARFGLAGAI